MPDEGGAWEWEEVRTLKTRDGKGVSALRFLG